jgi:hypothetical protein
MKVNEFLRLMKHGYLIRIIDDVNGVKEVPQIPWPRLKLTPE